MAVLVFVMAVVFGLVVLFVVIAAARRGSDARGRNDLTWSADGGSFFDSGSGGADCGSSDGGDGCDGGGGGDGVPCWHDRRKQMPVAHACRARSSS